MPSSTSLLASRPRQAMVLCIHLLVSVAGAQMPYNPTRILQTRHALYVFRPSPDTATQFELGTIDISSRVDAARLPYTTLYDKLPFLSNDTPRAFTPLLDNGGNMTVYTGDCAQGAGAGKIWTFTPHASDVQGKGSWKQKDVSVKGSTHTAVMGANYLAGGMTFSSAVDGNTATTSAYIFGGMCPQSGGASSSNWQSAANYSNLMVTLQPSGSVTKDIKYTMDFSASRGPPVPEAGFTVTGLTPTFSNRSDGTQVQQQNFLLVGGHTSAAFINMSQVALFSLPEQSWTFIGVKQPDAPRKHLAARSGSATLDPRSGHTAVLTSDGQRIIVLGGWVGDIETPAEPQLAVLDVAEGYGGQGDWQWSVPSTSGAGLPQNTGIYGHGAAMLPGGVLMVTGGYAITAPSSRHKRASSTANTKSYFFNVTSSTWITDYSPPSGVAVSEPTNSGPLSSPGQKAGLGVGIGIGLAAVCGLFAFYMWYTRRLKKQREVREKQIRDLAFTTHRYNVENYSPGFDGRGSHSDALDYLSGNNGHYYFPPGTQGGQGWRQTGKQDAERTGLLVEIPSPTRGLRRSLSGRPAFAPNVMRGPGQIHPIDELEEEQDEERQEDRSLGTVPQMAETSIDERHSAFDTAPTLDPSTDTHRRGIEQKGTAVPGTMLVYDDVVQGEHSSEPYAMGESSSAHRAALQTGRLSPDKSTSDRTGSNLSERSTRSGLSWTSSSGGLARSSSIRSAAILNSATNANPFRSPDGSPTREDHDRVSDHGRQSPVDPRTRSLTSIRSNGCAESEVFRTAQSSFTHLQAEGEALLGGNPERPRPGTSSSSSNTYRDTEATNSRAATATPATSYALDTTSTSRPPTRERRRSWLGSVRRVLTRSASGTDRTRSLTTTMSYHEPYTDNPASPVEPSAAENRKSFPTASVPPRRAASDASFWRNRRGKQDWLDEEQESPWKRTAGDDWGAPEDIMLAERERIRQKWRSRGNLLVNINAADDDELPTPRTPIRADQLGIPPAHSHERPCTPASEADWDVEAAVERRVVQVMFTVPKSKLRVVNADVDGSSILSLPREGREEADIESSPTRSGSPSRVKDIAGRFEQLSSSPRMSPKPSPSPSIKSLKIRARASGASLDREGLRKNSGQSSRTRERQDDDKR